MKEKKTTDWIQLYSGVTFYPLEPDSEKIDITDIAHALSMQCRFSGHTRVHYSVAEHSVRAAALLPRHLRLWGLLHDASEAYLVDIPRPLKHLPAFEVYRQAEKQLQTMIYNKFGLSGDEPEELRYVDNVLVVTEGRDLLGPQAEPWSTGAGVEPLKETIIPLKPEEAEESFLRVFVLLTAPNRKEV